MSCFGRLAGLYHLQAVDTVTQWQVVGCGQTFSERQLVPVGEAILPQFPFGILGWHCDNPCGGRSGR